MSPSSPGPAIEAPLGVLLVNRKAQGGGAERVALSIHEGLRRRGHRSWIAVGSRNLDAAGVLAIPSERRSAARSVLRAAAASVRRLPRAVPGARRLRRLLDEFAESASNAIAVRRGREPFDFPGTDHLATLTPESLDLVHAHNLHGGYFDLRQLAPLSHRLPVALTLHDEWAYTGHCAYTLGLATWQTGCHSCPDLGIYPAIRRDATHENWEAKRRIYAASRLYVGAPSRWLLDRARTSILAPGAAAWRVIPNGVDRELFRPGDRAAARARLGLPVEGRILLFTANRAGRSPFKDVATVFAAARAITARLPEEPLLLLALGDEGPSERVGNAELRYVPYEADQDRLAAHYRAADVYLHAAHADNFPTTILEALASGVPVVATAVGGIPEQVRSLSGAAGAWSGEAHAAAAATGVLVEPGDADGMAAATTEVLSNPALGAQLGANGVADAAARFDLERQLDATIAWYLEVIADWRAWAGRSAASIADGGSGGG